MSETSEHHKTARFEQYIILLVVITITTGISLIAKLAADCNVRRDEIEAESVRECLAVGNTPAECRDVGKTGAR